MIKQVESQSNQELLWRGTINQYGKQQEFFIESLLPFKDSFRGYMVFDDLFFTLLGDFEDSKDEKVRFSILAHHENNLAYRMWGHFEKYELILNLSKIGTLNFPLTLKMNFLSLPCTVYSEPYQTLYTGRARISDILFVMFYINEKLNMITGKKNKHGVYVANLYKGNSVTENIILKQVKNPSKVKDRQALSFVDERGQLGFVIEVFEN